MSAKIAHGARSGSVLRTFTTTRFGLSERSYTPNSESPVHTHQKTYIIITIDGHYLSTFDSGADHYSSWTVTYHHAGLSHNSRYTVRGAHVLYIEIPQEELSVLWPDPVSHLSSFSLHGGKVEWTARQLFHEFQQVDGYSSMAVDGLIMQLSAHLMRDAAGRPQRLPIWLGKANELIRSRFNETLAVQEIAKLVHVHPGHLAREYMRHYRCTIGEQIRRLRVEYACRQLSSTSHCLADIALDAGFSDQSHLTVSFRQQLGITPSEYRKTVKTMSLA